MKLERLTNNGRNRKILLMYRMGNTLQEVGNKFRFSRARAQQIVFKEIKKEIIDKLKLKHLNKEEKRLLDVAVKEEIEEVFSRRRGEGTKKHREIMSRKIKAKMKLVPHYSVFLNLHSYTEALGENSQVFTRYFPDIANYLLNKRKNRWSRNYDKCRVCGTTSIPHGSYGFCKKCYLKSVEFKQKWQSYRLRNLDKIRLRQNEYVKQYNKRPEVIKKREKRWDLANFGGNRGKALERDNYKCRLCSMSQEESFKKLGRNLHVFHLDVNKGNELENLKTVCSKCYNQRMMQIMRKKLAETRRNRK